ncbi:MAG: PaREP1 family protein [Pyrobaculum sp.]|uniref:PaREP1 family protein n=1 Tax=Pyrobaculum sp. TaxID=2004705 RepID=UPI00315F6A74
MISAQTLEILRKAAGGKDVDEYVLRLVAEKADPPIRVEAYLRLHEKYLREAEELYSKGDLLQAGEKYWGAVAALINAIAEKRGWEHYSHRDYNIVVRRLYEETGDPELIIGFRVAEGLHANFYHNYMGPKDFQVHREAVLTLVEKLKKILAEAE